MFHVARWEPSVNRKYVLPVEDERCRGTGGVGCDQLRPLEAFDQSVPKIVGE